MENIQTNWHVLTGGHASGKSTALEELAYRGYKILPEVARTIFDREIVKGRTREQIRGSNEKEFQQIVLETKLDIEKNMPPEETIFIECGIPNSIQSLPDQEEEIITLSRDRIYKSVFLLDPVKAPSYYLGKNNGKTPWEINAELKKAYEKVGYEVISIPAGKIKLRVNSILKSVNI